MNLQYGEQVAEYRSKHRIEVVLPADAPNVAYAVTQLCGGDPDVRPKIVVQTEVFLTAEQLQKLRNLTDLELLAIRNSVNPTTILSARVLEEPVKEVYHKPKLTAEERSEILRKSLAAAGYKGVVEEKVDQWPKWYRAQGPGAIRAGMSTGNLVCARQDSETSGVTYCQTGSWSWNSGSLDGTGVFVQITTEEAIWLVAQCLPVNLDDLCEKSVARAWYQHRDPDIILCRVAPTRCVYFEKDSFVPDVFWDYHYDEWVKTGDLTLLTETEALMRVRNVREKALREQYLADANPKPWHQVCSPMRFDPITQQPEPAAPEPSTWQQNPVDRNMVIRDPKHRSYLMKMTDLLTPGIWIVLDRPDRHEIHEIKEPRKLSVAIPAAMISGPVGLKIPIEYRKPVMPKDYGRVVHYSKVEFATDAFEYGTALLHGHNPQRGTFVLHDPGSDQSLSINEKFCWIVDEPTNG